TQIRTTPSTKITLMKKAFLKTLAIILAATSLQVAAAEYESTTVTVFPASLFEEKTEKEIITFSDQGFDFIASADLSVDFPTISAKQNFLRLYDENSLTIKSPDGVELKKIVLNISDYYLGYTEINGTASGWEQNPDDLSEWNGQAEEFKLTVSYVKRPELDNDYNTVIVNYVNIESITITYLEEVEATPEPEPEPEPEPTPEYGAVELQFATTRVAYSGTTGTVDFTLNVANDDGVEKFTVIAKDHTTNVEYGRADFAPVEVEEPQGSPIRHEMAEGKHYSINGTIQLDGIDNGTEPTLRLSAFATYPDGSETHLDESKEPTVTVPDHSGTTGITDAPQANPASTEYYDLNGRRIAIPNRGIFIEKDGTRVVKKQL
ncbi:MAG: hypothetical protein K2L21_04260, partial [Muribaculaceae bacterium]|nr:hypothetical protein [Muribaculaceae bacterium]